MGWATFWAFFSQTDLVTLQALQPRKALAQFDYATHFSFHSCRQGCQMAHFQTKNCNLCNFWGYAMEDVGTYIYSHLVVFTSILLPFGILYGYLVVILLFWYVAPRQIWRPC
jgi:hypothetical protein